MIKGKYRMRANKTYYLAFRDTLAQCHYTRADFDGIMKKLRRHIGYGSIPRPESDEEVLRIVLDSLGALVSGEKNARYFTTRKPKSPRRPPIAPLPDDWLSLYIARQ